jgi:hypothetical protein
MSRDPKIQNHPWPVYVIGIFVWAIILFVAAGVVNHLGFSSHGPGLLRPLLARFEKKETPAQLALQKQKQIEEHQRFHHTVAWPRLPENQRPACVVCHANLPHNKSMKTRSMLNMHSTYLACETCHLEKTEAQTVVYRWYSPVEKNPQGPFFGTAYDPKTGQLEMVRDHFSKITPFYEKAGQLSVVLHEQDLPMARDYVKIRDRYTPEQRKDETLRFHVDVRSKGLDCQTCHSTTGILNFKALGFSPKRIVDIEQLNIKGMITKYNEFYLPDLFK